MDEQNGIGWALDQMAQKRAVTRAGWNGPGQFLRIAYPVSHSEMDLPYIYISTVDGRRVPWLASQTDILSEDWRLAKT